MLRSETRCTRSTKSGPGRCRRSFGTVRHTWFKRESASFPSHCTMRSMSDTSRGLFPVVRIHPATRQALPRGEHQIGFRKTRRIRHLFAGVEPAFCIAPEGIEKRLHIHNLDPIPAWPVSEKHDSSAFMIHGLDAAVC